MNHLIRYSKNTLAKYTNPRDLEIKFGEAVATLDANTSLKETPEKHVLIGIPEDIGVRANHGISGTSNAWKACLSVLCNMQENSFTNSKKQHLNHEKNRNSDCPNNIELQLQTGEKIS